jgi:hypothetical protein
MLRGHLNLLIRGVQMGILIRFVRIRVTEMFGHHASVARAREATGKLAFIGDLAEAVGFGWGEA